MLPDAIDVLNGNARVLDINLDLDGAQRLAYIDAIINYMREVSDDGQNYPENWDDLTDNFMRFLMDNFGPEENVYAMIHCWREHMLDFNSETETFGEWFEKYQSWIV